MVMMVVMVVMVVITTINAPRIWARKTILGG